MVEIQKIFIKRSRNWQPIPLPEAIPLKLNQNANPPPSIYSAPRAPGVEGKEQGK